MQQTNPHKAISINNEENIQTLLGSDQPQNKTIKDDEGTEYVRNLAGNDSFVN